jgi:hypothetical protein
MLGAGLEKVRRLLLEFVVLRERVRRVQVLNIFHRVLGVMRRKLEFHLVMLWVEIHMKESRVQVNMLRIETLEDIQLVLVDDLGVTSMMIVRVLMRIHLISRKVGLAVLLL